MNEIDAITKALAAKYSGLDLSRKEEKKEEPAAPQRVEYSRSTTGRAGDSTPSSKPPTVMPMDRIILGVNRSTPPPKRPMVMMSSFKDEDLEELFKTPARRGWEFSTWLEVIGLPPDLHEKLDAPLYQYAARAFLARKREAHGPSWGK